MKINEYWTEQKALDEVFSVAKQTPVAYEAMAQIRSGDVDESKLRTIACRSKGVGSVKTEKLLNVVRKYA